MIRVVFFDIGNTLAARTPDGTLKVFEPGSPILLRAMKSVLGLRLGAISNLPPDLGSVDFAELLSRSGLMSFFDPAGIVTNHDAGVDKPDRLIYEFAARRMEAPVSDCLYIGEDPDEVAGAQMAGMSALLKPFPPQD